MKKRVKTLINMVAKRSTSLNKVMRYARKARRARFYDSFYEEEKVHDKTVVFMSFMGRSQADSPFEIYKHMLEDPYFDDWSFVWAFKKKQLVGFRKRARLFKVLFEDLRIDPKHKKNERYEIYRRTSTVRYGSPSYYQTLASAKYWVTNSRILEGVRPKENQVYVQCWHGTPLKRLGADIAVGGNAMHSREQLASIYQDEATKWTYLISPSSFYTEKMKSAFVIEDGTTEIIEEGYPRNDFLVNYDQEDIDSIKRYFNIPRNKKVLLYAPTWRDNQHDSSKGYVYDDLGIDFDMLYESLGDDWVVLFRAHYFIANSFNFSQYRGFVYNASKHKDINELYIIADVLVTDYSSVFFDYSILQRPILFFMYDKEQYAEKLRGFYIELDALPGDIIETNEGLIDTLSSFDTYKTKHKKKLKEFSKTYCPMDDGSASKRVADAVFKQN